MAVRLWAYFGARVSPVLRSRVCPSFDGIDEALGRAPEQPFPGLPPRLAPGGLDPAAPVAGKIERTLSRPREPQTPGFVFPWYFHLWNGLLEIFFFLSLSLSFPSLSSPSPFFFPKLKCVGST